MDFDLEKTKEFFRKNGKDKLIIDYLRTLKAAGH